MSARIRCKKCRKQFTPRRGTRRENCYECRPERHVSGPGAETPSDPKQLEPGTMHAAVLAELRTLGSVGSLEGAVALRLALSLDDPGLGAAQVSSISNQLLKTMEPLRKLKPREPDKLDEQAASVAAKIGVA